MARRKHQEEELPFVALMDTMTNVVGVLIIVLVMVGIGLAQSVHKVLSDLPPVTPEEHEKLKKEVEAATPKEDPKKVEEQIAKLEKDLKKADDDLKTLDLTKDKQNIKIVDLAAIKKQLEAKQKERDSKKEAVDKLLAEIDRLKKQLDTTPVYQPAAATIVKLPNPRPLPDKAEIHRFFIAGGKITYINDEQLSDVVEQELRRNETDLVLSREIVKGPDGKPVMVKDKTGRPVQQRKVVYDSKKVAAFFANNRLGGRHFKLEVVPVATSPRIPVRLTPLPTAGETLEQGKTMLSVFQTTIRKVKADPKGVVWFHVYKDSIETYLAAREFLDQAGIPVGWELTGNPYFARSLPTQYTVNYTPAPPPANPVVTIAPPKTTLD